MTLLYPHFLWLLFPLVLLLWRNKEMVTSFIHVVILLFLVLALSRPIEEKALQQGHIEAKDIIIALDVSYSMRATDLQPSRYHFAKKTINRLLEKNPADNIMLMAFTTNPLLLSPPTTDYTLITVALESLNPKFILTKGTSLTNLFNKLSTMNLSNKQLILITDGGEETSFEKIKSLIQKSQVTLTVLALGTKKGTTLQTGNGALLKDNNGNLVISRVNPYLNAFTKSIQGTYVKASFSPEETANALNKILHDNTIEKKTIQKMQKHHIERYQIPLFIALILFLLLHTRAVKVLIIGFAFFGITLQASLLDDYHLTKAYTAYEKNDFNRSYSHLKKISTPTLQSQMALANTYYKQQNYKKSVEVYASIRSTSNKIKQHVYYNMANAYTLLKAYDKAKIYYTKTLQLGPDRDALANLGSIVFLNKKKDDFLGIAHPKSQSSDSSKSDNQKNKDNDSKEDAPSSSAESSGESGEEEQKDKQKKLMSNNTLSKQPLSSKVYELINKGYIRETKPW